MGWVTKRHLWDVLVTSRLEFLSDYFDCVLCAAIYETCFWWALVLCTSP